MNRNQENGFHQVKMIEQQPSQAVLSGPPPSEKVNAPYVPQKDKPKSSLKDNGRVLAIGAGLVVVLLLLAFQGISHQSLSAKKPSVVTSSQNRDSSAEHSPASITPIIETAKTPAQETDGSQISPDQIAHTATKAPKPSAGKDLASVAPFDAAQQWQPAPYQPQSQPAASVEPSGTSAINANVTAERGSLDKASLVFVRNAPASAVASSETSATAPDWGIGLPPGTRLRARLEAAVSTAVSTPVVAVIEYNYEQNGEIVVPSGAKAFGHLEAADRSGYLGIHFESLLMPDGSSVAVEAAATDLQLVPVRGRVEGKHTGKNILVRSFAGMGEIAATLVGRGSLSQSLSEGDLLRERLTNNIGQASDQTVANLVVSEHIIVTIPADTEIYVVLQKPIKQVPHELHPQLPPPRPPNQANVDELRQLLQLQRELNQSVTKAAQE